MCRGTTICGKSTRLGRGKRGISISPSIELDEQFFVLACLIHSAATSSKEERAEAAGEALCNCCNFASRPHDGVLNNFRRLVDAIDQVLTHTVEAIELDIQRFTRIRDHGLDAPELISGSEPDLDETGRSG